MIRNLLFLIYILGSLVQCAQQKSNNAEQLLNGVPKNEKSVNKQSDLYNGIQIENKINRGINYTDPLGMDYSIRYIPITITNESTSKAYLQIAFAKEYNYPEPYIHEKFRLIPLPEEWALDGVEISDGMMNELPSYIKKPVLNETIAPGEKLIFAIGSIYPRPARTTGVLPRILFVQNGEITFPDCEWYLEKDQTSGQPIKMGLKVIFGQSCRIIPGGSISYSKY
jgi:hypothetical protein